AAQDLDRGADGRVLAGLGDAASGGGRALLLFFLGDARVGRRFLLDDLERGAEAERFFEGFFEGGFGVLDDGGLAGALAEANLDAGAVDFERDGVLEGGGRARFAGGADGFDEVAKTRPEIERVRVEVVALILVLALFLVLVLVLLLLLAFRLHGRPKGRSLQRAG